MKKLFMFAMSALLLVSCDKDETAADSSFEMEASVADYAAASLLPKTTVSGAITTNTTWDNDHVWVLSGIVRVTAGTLTIEPGTFIIADASVSGTTGVLVVSKGGTINAVGLNPDGSCNPIVFTSSKLLDNNAATTAVTGDFGGVVILGEAPVNTGTTTNRIEGLNTDTPAADFEYGGNIPADNSGTLRYVRIEFAGRVIGDPELGNEINGLTLGGVGSGTTINHIQVTYGRDDAFEFFGGTVNASHLVAFGQDDDAFDFDLGYTGTINKAIAIANRNSTHSLSGGNPDSNGIELDNNAGGTSTSIITRPVITDLSILGYKAIPTVTAQKLENAIHVRRLGQINLTNASVSGYETGIRFDSPSLRSDSFLGNMRVHAFTTIILPVGSSLGTGGAAPSTLASANTWGTGSYQPFYNEASFSLAAGTTGAFANEPNWTDCWTKWNGFTTIYE
ncbi:hypothetical protein FMM05_00965 [Flavobacterium zepuense]|uniref:Lipoprotein n=1 Tax=Flavobacterium zepuense TaxID=2593302 RepID=A0A552V9X5_9FLAO|nr:hypothetical protein [Flavobacterium zepuense]TRW27239.1 hypothetical protein FMM05_00965 [Flavobacterium zepuense]